MTISQKFWYDEKKITKSKEAIVNIHFSLVYATMLSFMSDKMVQSYELSYKKK